MDKLIIRGGNRLSGTIPISGAKNAALTLIPCALLTDEPLTLRNLPRLADIDGFQHLMTQFGASVEIHGKRPEDFGRVVTFEASRLTSTVAPYDLVRKMRASILVLGPMLARAGEATVSLPGGCAIGNRPIDLHLKALEAFGAHIELAQGYVKAFQPDGGMKGGDFDFPVVSVGATENALMAAVLAEGTCRLFNAAREPEIIDLCNLLTAMGAEIEGIGTSDLVIHPVKRLHGATYRTMPDRIEAGSYACAAAITGGAVRLEGAKADDMHATIHALRNIGVHVNEDARGIDIETNGPLKPVNLTTAPYPGLATDMQAQLMALLCRAEGTSVLKETIFENRFMHVPELARMGADVSTEGRTAIVKGVERLTGAEVMATDLRASMSLVIAALAAEGETQVRRIYHLDRGYERLEEKLQLAGADIERVDD
ncbi:UDP-N-acetylglucosamine 1-carboxyvinyltransferase [Erythrobacter litoralis]|jgi:UDP-N-acetylglucosamine 1-carboxyvinyltransferase|uniref:UDP-N-acetylglucosamine 1-carboxyvinyltransferase n=1 Tax=Erythrobacter litoralis TaxID=39960 RepID=A0A074MUG5_9SPHN|nr:UDP-N-acetylglucosamine 1-carboxyvinyltransferase [Erythrobacter litoralis]AOL24931.1 UDP-N-acetylglucosamine 1-carboxyvinyltransferase [Erythrobacter litoralis]KEO96455.1 UDP-N-acetylglucosamine 1-carboxyvinyltransferase [Erythrobacter litoralis]MEE4338784.1 UDP-N-acetylglucosamine 1-carboxyvinyltransferase [Erythrobacter sp.]